MSRSRKKKVVLLVLTVCFMSINFFKFWSDGINRHRHQMEIRDGGDGPPTILVWVEPVHHSNHSKWKIPTNELCGGGCHVTSDQAMLDVSDAVVFYMKRVKYSPRYPYLLPHKGYPSQLFVWWCHESPHVTSNFYRRTLAYPANYFNYTMTYNRNSDIAAAMIPVSALDWYLHRIGRGDEADEKQLESVTNEEEFEQLFANLMKKKNKDKLAAWVASDCHHVKGAFNRLQFVNKLQSIGDLNLDTFGKCGNFSLSMDHHFMYSTIQSYKFFLAFENTRNCSGYITEKFWYNSLYTGAVPVVDGSSRAEYERVAPPNSFIHVDDFDRDPVRIADHLKEVAANDWMYKEYFKWWMMPGFYPIFNLREPQDEELGIQNVEQDYEVGGFCHLCRILNKRRKSIKITHRTVEDLAEFYYDPETSFCTTQEQ